MHWPGNKREVQYAEGVFSGYRCYDIKKTPLLYPFGHGLSYTQFAYTDLTLDSTVLTADRETVSVSLLVKNTGTYDGAEVVQLYVGMFDDVVRRPEKELKEFRKIFLKADEEQRVTFCLDRRAFSFYYEDYHEWYAPEGDYHILIGASSQDIRLRASLHLVPQHSRKKPLSGWSTVGQLRETPEGESAYHTLMTRMKEYVPNPANMPFASMLSDEKINQMPLRFINLITCGQIDNDELLALIAEVNEER